MRPDRSTLAAFVGFVLISGAVSVAIRAGSLELPPFWAATLRYAVAVAILFGVALAFRIPLPRGGNLVGALLMSVTYVVSIALTYAGVSASSASMGALAFALTPLATLVLAAAMDLERFTVHGAAGALVAASGMAVVMSDQLGAAVAPDALLALIGAMFFAALTAVVIKRVPPGHPIAANAVGGAFVLPILLALSAATNEPWIIPSLPETWVGLVFLAVFGTVLLFPLALFIIGRWTASGYSYTGLFKPLAGVALAAVILGEPVRPPFVLGGAIVIVGVWVGTFGAPSVRTQASDGIETSPRRAREPVAADEGVAG